jgi:hypothetical protein
MPSFALIVVGAGREAEVAMERAYDPVQWHEVFVMIGGAAAALAGLLFVAASLHSDFLMRAPHWRLRVFNNTLITAMVIEAALILIPQDELGMATGSI